MKANYEAADLALDTAYKAADSALNINLSKDIDAVELKADTNNAAINTINNTTIPGINGRLDGLDKRVDDHYDSWKGTEQALKDADTALQKKIDDVSADLGENTSEKTAFVLIQENANIIEEIQKDIGTVGDKSLTD